MVGDFKLDVSSWEFRIYFLRIYAIFLDLIQVPRNSL